MSHPSDERLKDLLFELVTPRAPKFLIAVSSNPTRESELRTALDQELVNCGKSVTDVFAESLKSGMLDVFSDRSRSEASDGISISNIDDLDVAGIQQLFADLNFHRDWLAKLNVPIILWISTSLLDRLIKLAPDFWSRRSAVYYFDGGSISELLDKLFARAQTETKEWSPEPTLSDAFEKILSCEKELGRCLHDKKSFSLAKVDDVIRNIRMGVSQLIDECEKGRQIEVALWFWNLSHLDLELQDMLDALQPEMRNRFESLYTDRNEALLHLCESVTSVLRDYLDRLRDNIRDKKRVSLVSRARSVAAAEINRMASALASTAEVSLSTLDYKVDSGEQWSAYDEMDMERFLLSKVAEDSGQQGPVPDEMEMENSFLAKAAEDLEGWLAGHTERHPPFFSKEEARLLKILYSSRAGTSAIVLELGTSQRKTLDKVRFLERKLRLYLGLPERSQVSKSARSPHN